jgi:hypothetical protein
VLPDTPKSSWKLWVPLPVSAPRAGKLLTSGSSKLGGIGTGTTASRDPLRLGHPPFCMDRGKEKPFQADSVSVVTVYI